MGKVRMGILDGFKGKVGTVVGSFWKGKKVMRAYNEFPTNPRTSAQVMQRQKFAIVANIGGTLSNILKMTLKGYANGEQNSLIGQFVMQNMKNVRTSGSSVEVAYDKLELTPPNHHLTAVALGEANFTTPLTVSVPIDDSYFDERENSKADKVYLVVYSKTGRGMVASNGTATRDDDSVSVSVPGHWQGHYVEVFAFVMGDPTLDLTRDQWSETIYCGSGRIA